MGPVGSLVLRPKPSPIGLASPLPKGTGRAGTQRFSPVDRGLGGLAGLPRPPNFGPRYLGMDFIVKGGMGNSWRCSGLPAAAAARAGEPRGPGAGEARVGGGGAAAGGVPAPGRAGGGAAAESPASREIGPFAD